MLGCSSCCKRDAVRLWKAQALGEKPLTQFAMHLAICLYELITLLNMGPKLQLPLSSATVTTTCTVISLAVPLLLLLLSSCCCCCCCCQLGYYFEPSSGLFGDASSGMWYKYHEDSQTYQLVESA
jgi:ABC-type polysaccharide/polyol phosphate export permease